MRVAAFQMVAKTGDVAANLAHDRRCGGARRGGAAPTVIVAPELATTGYGSRRSASAASPSRPTGAQVAALAGMASKHGIAIVAGFAERAGDAIYNSAALVDARRPAGRSIANASSTATTSGRCSRPATPRRRPSSLAG